MYDLVEWAAAQPWCDGNVGMIGISYFAMTQLEAAVERPPHLKAIFPVAVDGRPVRSRVAPRPAQLVVRHAVPGDDRADVGRAATTFWREPAVEAARHVLHTPPLHRKFATMNGEAAVDDAARAAASCTTTRTRGTTCGWTPVVEHPAARRVVGRAQPAPAARATSTSRCTWAATGRTCRCICRRPSRRGKRWRTTRMCGWACSASSA